MRMIYSPGCRRQYGTVAAQVTVTEPTAHLVGAISRRGASACPLPAGTPRAAATITNQVVNGQISVLAGGQRKVRTPRGECSGFGRLGWSSFGAGFAHAVAVAGGDDDVGVVEEPVEHGGGGGGLGQEPSPFLERPVTGDHQHEYPSHWAATSSIKAVAHQSRDVAAVARRADTDAGQSPRTAQSPRC